MSKHSQAVRLARRLGVWGTGGFTYISYSQPEGGIGAIRNCHGQRAVDRLWAARLFLQAPVPEGGAAILWTGDSLGDSIAIALR